MTQYNTLNAKLFNWKFSKSKSGIKNGTEVTLKLPSNDDGDSNNEYNFWHKLSLTNTQVSELCKAITNGSLANRKLPETHLHKIGQSVGFSGRFLRLLLYQHQQQMQLFIRK